MRSPRYLLYGATIILTLTWLPLIIITVHRSVTVISGLRHVQNNKDGNKGKLQKPSEERHEHKPKPNLFRGNPDIDYLSHTVNFEDAEAKMEKRRETMQKACEETGLNIPGEDPEHVLNAWEYLINKEYNLIWCNVFKAASTSWLYNFNILAGYTSTELRKSKVSLIELARRRYPRPSATELLAVANSSHTFIIARHPFERLLSAYRDKILRPIVNTVHHKLGFQIIQTYRFNVTVNKKRNRAIRSNRPTFPEFVSYLIDEYKKTPQMDFHWIPIHRFCTPCLIPFNIIMKFETLNEDSSYLIEKANIAHRIRPEWKNPNKELVKTSSLMQYYYSQLSDAQKKALYNIYRYDFKIFDYSEKEYLT